MVKIKPGIFRAYDIRGIYPQELNKETAEIIGRAFIKFLRSKRKKKKLRIVVGRDNRLSSPVLSQALKKGILNEGAAIIDIGLSPTPVFYFAVWKYGFDGGVLSTASHNPPEYNGFKIVGKEARMIGDNTGLKEIKKMAISEAKQEIGLPSLKIERVKKKNVLKDYLKFNFKYLNLELLRPLKIAIDTGNAVPGILVKELKEYLPCKIYHLFLKLDGSFPNHLPDPLEEENIKDLKKLVREKKLDLGLAFDGDGDRIVFVDERGKMIPPDLITCLLSEIILKEFPKSKILYSICSSNIIKETIRKAGGTAIAVRIGHTFVKEKMKKEKAVFAGEYSGHYFHKEHNSCEAPLFVLFKVLEETSRKQQPISRLTSIFEKYSHSGTVNLEVEDKKMAQEVLEKRYRKGKISRLDGIRIDFNNWWFNVRPSNTEPLLRITVEAKTRPLMKEKLQEVMKIIKVGA